MTKREDEIEEKFDGLHKMDFPWTIVDFSYDMVHRYCDKNGIIPKDQVSHLVSDFAHSFSYSLHRTLNDLGIKNYGELIEMAKKYKGYKGD